MEKKKKIENTMSDHPELQELLDSVDLDLDNLFNNDNDDKDNSDNEKEHKKNTK